MANRSLNWLAGRLDLRVAVSDDARELAERYFGGTYDVLFNGVELDRYRSTPTVPRRGPTIIFCGRHEPRKGLDVLLDAMAELPDDVRCWVASDGPDTEELRARFGADDRIEWLGRISDEEKIARLAAADVFCAPSLAGRVVRRRAARGHGRRHPDRGHRPARLPAGGPARTSTRC